MAERELSGEAAEDVPAETEIGEQQDLDRDMHMVHGEEHREVRQEREREHWGGDHAGGAHRARAPNRPSGLNSSTRMNSTNGSTGAVEPGMNNAPSDSVIATTKLANSAPMKLPMPPSTTTTKAMRMKNEPMLGTI